MIDGGMKAAVLALARDEVTAIWKQYGIEIVWEERWTPDQAEARSVGAVRRRRAAIE